MKISIQQIRTSLHGLYESDYFESEESDVTLEQMLGDKETQIILRRNNRMKKQILKNSVKKYRELKN